MHPCDDRNTDPELDPEVLRFIGEQLRQLYADIVAEPVPERLQRLVDRLARLERQHELTAGEEDSPAD